MAEPSSMPVAVSVDTQHFEAVLRILAKHALALADELEGIRLEPGDDDE